MPQPQSRLNLPVMMVVKNNENKLHLHVEFSFTAPKGCIDNIKRIIVRYKKFLTFVTKKMSSYSACEELVPGKKYIAKVYKRTHEFGFKECFDFLKEQGSILVGPKGLLFILGNIQENREISWVISFGTNSSNFSFVFQGENPNEFELRCYDSNIVLGINDPGYLLCITEKNS